MITRWQCNTPAFSLTLLEATSDDGQTDLFPFDDRPFVHEATVTVDGVAFPVAHFRMVGDAAPDASRRTVTLSDPLAATWGWRVAEVQRGSDGLWFWRRRTGWRRARRGRPRAMPDRSGL